ncbi:unnamed protein product [Musa hybrid cultivar]
MTGVRRTGKREGKESAKATKVRTIPHEWNYKFAGIRIVNPMYHLWC